MSENREKGVFSVRMEPDLKHALADLSDITSQSMNSLINYFVRLGLSATYLNYDKQRPSIPHLYHMNEDREQKAEKWINYFRGK